jgi:long-chain acyl-CoA synthetase
MQGYWKNPRETAKVLTADGWLKTGDVVVMDEHGRLEIVDRKKDLIIVSGFNVYPSEIEQVLDSHPEIIEAGVVGVSQHDGPDIIKAVIVRKQQQLTAEAVIDYCRENLTAYKVPKIIEFTKALPKTNVGKVLRRSL